MWDVAQLRGRHAEQQLRSNLPLHAVQRAGSFGGDDVIDMV